MTRDTIIMKIVEGFMKDVLTYDAGAHHPRPGRRAKHMRPAGSSRSASSPPLGRHDPKKFYPRATSSAARKPGSAPKGKSKVGKRLAMFAAPYAAIGVYKGYKSLRDRVEVHKMLRKAKKQNSPKESVVEMKMGRPYTLASNRRISFRRKPVRWPFRKPFEMGAPTGLTREMHQRGDIRVIESMDKEKKAKWKARAKKAAIGAGSLVAAGAAVHGVRKLLGRKGSKISAEQKDAIRSRIAKSRAHREYKWFTIPPGAGRKIRGIGLRDTNKYRLGDYHKTRSKSDTAMSAIRAGDMPTARSIMRHVKKRGLRERLIEAIIEVFDDRYSASVFSKDRRKKQQGALLRKARKLKARAARKKYAPETSLGNYAGDGTVQSHNW